VGTNVLEVWVGMWIGNGNKQPMFPLWFTTFLGGSFVFLDVGPSILFLVFPFGRWGGGGGAVLWLIYGVQGFHRLLSHLHFNVSMNSSSSTLHKTFLTFKIVNFITNLSSDIIIVIWIMLRIKQL
jgi:hypothetical protein